MSDLTHLIEGVSQFQEQLFGNNPELAKQLTKGQQPKALLIGCCDSRVDPALLTNCAPGDIFQVRNIANLVPPYQHSHELHGVSAALEYAVNVLQVSNIIILGHSQCGGIAGLMGATQDKPPGEFISNWVNIAAPAKAKVLREMADNSPEERARACEKEAILVSLNNLMSFPWISARVTSGEVTLHGWYYDITSGRLNRYNQQTASYEVLVEPYSSSLAETPG